MTTTTENKVARASAQSLFLEMEFEGSKLATGTGFVSMAPKGPVLITNRHNVTGRRQDTGELLSKTGGIPTHISILHNRTELFSWVWRREPLYSLEGKPLWREHPRLGPRADFVALPLTQVDDVALYPHECAQKKTEFFVGPSDPVSVIGFPFGLSAGGAFGVWATGFLASEPAVDFNDLPIQLIDCRTRPGQSGSPVIAYRGQGMVTMAHGGMGLLPGPRQIFIGIYSGRINDESDLGIVWKASAIAELIDSLND